MLDLTNELLGRSPQLRFFVSSRMNGTLDRERKTVVQAIEEGGVARAWLWERDAAAGPYSSVEVCIRHAETSDGLFLILANELTDITRREYLAAKKAGAPTFILLRDGMNRPADMLQFITDERNEAVTVAFRNHKELRAKVRQAIDVYSASAWRANQQDRRAELIRQERDRAWQLNEVAHDLAQHGKHADAVRQWRQMEAIGIELDDQYIVSTARHNFGAQAHLSGDYQRAREWYLTTLQTKFAIGDRLSVLQILLNLAGLAEEEGKLEQAEQRLRAMEAALRALHEPELLATLYGNFARLAARHRDLRGAEKYFLHSLLYARRSGSAAHTVTCMRNLGMVRVEQGRLKPAIQWFRKALAIAQENQLVLHVQACHRHLAATLHMTGEREEALYELERVLRVAEEVGDQLDTAVATFEIGMVSAELGDAQSSRTHLEAALQSFRSLGSGDWQQRVLRAMLETDRILEDSPSVCSHADELLRLIPRNAHADRADALKAAGVALLTAHGDRNKTRNYYERAMAAMKKYLSPEEVAWQYVVAGATLSQNGAAHLSLPFFDQALNVYRELCNRKMECHVLNDRGNALARLDRQEEAVSDFRACLDIATEIGDAEHEFKALLNLGEMTRRGGDPAHAVEQLTRLVERVRQEGTPSMLADAERNLGAALIDLDDLDAAADVYIKMRAYARAARNPDLEILALRQLGWIELKRCHLGRAANHYARAVRMVDETVDPATKIETVASLVEVESALGRAEDTQRTLQELVDLVGRHGGGSAVWQRVAASARYWARKGDYAAAATFFSLSIAFAASGVESSNEEFAARLVKPLVYIVLAARHDNLDEGRIYDALTHDMADRFEMDAGFVRARLEQLSRDLPPEKTLE